MPTGEASNSPAFTDGQLRDISQALNAASAETGLHFSAYVGTPDGPSRAYAERLLAALTDRAPVGVLILVSPGDRRLEIVTGSAASRRVPDRSCALAALSMRTAFVGGDLVGGIVTGIRMLAETAGEPPELGTSSHGRTSPALGAVN